MSDSTGEYMEHRFRERLQKAQNSIQRILNTEKASALHEASNVSHKYSDKYLLAEQATKCALTAVLNSFLGMGMTVEQLQQAIEWSKDRSVTFSLNITRNIEFEKKTEREEESANRLEIERTGVLAGKTTIKTVTKIIEYHFIQTFHWELTMFRGTGHDPQDRRCILSRDAVHHYHQRTETPTSIDRIVTKSVFIFQETTLPGLGSCPTSQFGGYSICAFSRPTGPARLAQS